MKRQYFYDLNVSMISLFQYIFAILVIVLHTQRIFQNDVLHFIQKSMFSRMAVSFFILSSSFFTRLNEAKGQGNSDDY